MDDLRARLKAAIFDQESGGGRADTSKPNYAGAQGGMQVTQATFEGMKRQGLVPADWNLNNPQQAIEAGYKLVDHLADTYKDDPVKVAAAYYSGPKAVRSDGSIADLRDPQNARAPSTHGYIGSVLARMGLDGDAYAPTSSADNRPLPTLDSWSNIPAPGKFAPVKEAAGKPVPAPLPGLRPLDESGAGITAALSAETARNKAETADIEAGGVLDSAIHQFAWNGLGGALTRWVGTEATYPPKPGYQPREMDKELYAGRSEADHAFLDEARSHEEALYRDLQIQYREDDMREAAKQGAGVAIMGSLIGGLPEGALVGFGAARTFALAKAAKAFTGAPYAAPASRAGAYAQSLGEQLTGNLGAVGVQASFDPYVSKEDAVMAVGASVLFAGLDVKGWHASDPVALRATGEKIQAAAANEMTAARAEAVANVGADASPEVLRAEVRKVEAEEVKRSIDSAEAPQPAENRINPEIAPLVDEEVQAAEAAAAKAAESDVKPAKAEQGAKELEDVAERLEAAWRKDAAPQTEPLAVADRPPELPGADVWMREDGEAGRRAMYNDSPKIQAQMKSMTEGMTLAEGDALPNGVHLRPGMAADPAMRPVRDAIEALQKQVLKDSRIVLSHLGTDSRVNGAVMSFGKTHFIGIKPGVPSTRALTTAIHELGHAVVHQHLKDAPPGLLDMMAREYNKFAAESMAGLESAAFKRFSEGSAHVTGADIGQFKEGAKLSHALGDSRYVRNFDEYSAEAFVRFIQRNARADKPEVALTRNVVQMLKGLWESVKSLWEKARGAGYLPNDEPFDEFFRQALGGKLTPGGSALKGEGSSSLATYSMAPLKEGTGTPVDRIKDKAISRVWDNARKWVAANPVDPKRLSRLFKDTMFDSTSSVLIRSKNPVARMVSGMLLESGGGAGGRRSNAAMAKWIAERKFMGNTINDVQTHYTAWRNANGGSLLKDYQGDGLNAKFNRLVAMEIEARATGRSLPDTPESVIKAADVYEAAYDRLRVGQIEAGTNDAKKMPATSRGFMPHQLSKDAVLNMTPQQGVMLQRAIAEQFALIDGLDAEKAERAARRYIDQVHRAALGGRDSAGAPSALGAGPLVEDAIQSLGLPEKVTDKLMKKYREAAPKQRLDLLKPYTDDSGAAPFRLIDLFETDQLKLLRGYTDRVSGEVALSKYGVQGRAGMGLLREAMRRGGPGEEVTAAEMEAFDQVSAEFLGEPFGTAVGKWADRAMQLNSIVRLGGMGISQIAETINGIFHVGAARTLESLSSMPRLRREALALAKGEKVDNPILSSLELHGGAEFGTDGYKMVFPFDEGNNDLRVYGRDSVHMADRLLRGAANMQGKLSFWRAINSAQYRGMAEQIVHKAVRFIREGGEDVALDDMGIDAALRAKLKADLPNIATFDGAGRLQRFDITRAKDLEAADAFVQAVHRGTGQIIQNERIGERGKWAHLGFVRLLTQFRSFSIISVEKQWARQVGNHGTAKAFGMMMGAMSVAAPIYMARVVLSAQGRADKEEYLEQNLTAGHIARATLNYISMSGLAGDFLDATSAITGIGSASGGRSGAQGQSFVGNVVAPAAGLADDLYKGIQNTQDGTDPHLLLKSLPFSRLPYLIPAVNGLADAVKN